MTPFNAVYSREPPTLEQFLSGETKTEAVGQEYANRDELLRQLAFNLSKAQQRMVWEANKHRREVNFALGDSIFLKLHPHKQSTLE